MTVTRSVPTVGIIHPGSRSQCDPFAPPLGGIVDGKNK